MTIPERIYEFRRELLERIPDQGFFNGLSSIFLYALLWPWSAAPAKKGQLAPPQIQRIDSRGAGDAPVALLVASRTAVKPGRYLASSDGMHWQWVRFSPCANGWSHELIHSPVAKGDTVGGLALTAVGLALLTTIIIVVLNRM